MKNNKTKHHLFALALAIGTMMLPTGAAALDNPGLSFGDSGPDRIPVIEYKEGASYPLPILIGKNAPKGTLHAAKNLSDDFKKVCGRQASVIEIDKNNVSGPEKKVIIIGTMGDPVLASLFKTGKLDKTKLDGKNEKYILKTIDNPMPGVEEAIVIAGSDKRGTIYGIYELSEQIGVSPWYDWADVPVSPRKELYLKKGEIYGRRPCREIPWNLPQRRRALPDELGQEHVWHRLRRPPVLSTRVRTNPTPAWQLPMARHVGLGFLCRRP